MKAISFETLKGLSRHDGGLSSAEIDAQRTRYGANDIVEVAGHPLFEIFIDTIKDPMICQVADGSKRPALQPILREHCLFVSRKLNLGIHAGIQEFDWFGDFQNGGESVPNFELNASSGHHDLSA